MCGIGGILRGNSTVEEGSLRRMGEAMAHRGPDDAGIWIEGGVGLVHRRLSVLDPTPAGHQPMQSAQGRYTIVYNGEIYNHLELRKDLEACGARFRTRCDTETLLAAYAAWGEKMLDRLNGMFAFAIYDSTRRCLFAARDRLGIKPFFYAQSRGALVFASELHALMRSGLVSDALCDAALDAYLRYLYIPAPDTIYQDVRKLGPGEKLRWDGRELRISSYWSPRYETDPGWTLNTAADRYRALLWDAVKLRRLSDVPLGAFLSGGLDSTSVVAALSDQSDVPVKTFSIGFDDAHADELRFAREAAAHFGTDHTEAVLRPDMVALLPQLARHFGEPFADSSALPTWLVSRLAREQVTLALSGDGGDELFAGYTWAHMNHRVAQYRRLPATARRLVGAGLAVLPPGIRTDKARRFHKDSFLHPDESYRRRLTCFLDDDRAALLRSPMNQKSPDRFAAHAARAAGLSDDDRMLYLDTVMYLPDDILTKVDRMSMAHGLEARTPLLDHRLVEFAATVPFGLKFHRGVSKLVAKRAMAKLLPPALLRQRKRGFSIPIDRWFREELGAHYRDAVLAPDARVRGYLHEDTAARLLESHQDGRVNAGHRLWAVLVLEHWLRERATGSC